MKSIKVFSLMIFSVMLFVSCSFVGKKTDDDELHFIKVSFDIAGQEEFSRALFLPNPLVVTNSDRIIISGELQNPPENLDADKKSFSKTFDKNGGPNSAYEALIAFKPELLQGTWKFTASVYKNLSGTISEVANGEKSVLIKDTANISIPLKEAESGTGQYAIKVNFPATEEVTDVVYVLSSLNEDDWTDVSSSAESQQAPIENPADSSLKQIQISGECNKGYYLARLSFYAGEKIISKNTLFIYVVPGCLTEGEITIENLNTPYSITYKDNVDNNRDFAYWVKDEGGNMKLPVSEYNSSMSITLPDTDDISRLGYEFLGWNTQSDGEGNWVTGWEAGTYKKDITLYARWHLIPGAGSQGVVTKGLLYDELIFSLVDAGGNPVNILTQNAANTIYVKAMLGLVDKTSDISNWKIQLKGGATDLLSEYTITDNQIDTKATLFPGKYNVVVSGVYNSKTYSATIGIQTLLEKTVNNNLENILDELLEEGFYGKVSVKLDNSADKDSIISILAKEKYSFMCIDVLDFSAWTDITEIPTEWFDSTMKLGAKEIILPPNITTIAASAFSGNTSLETITIPDSVTSIASKAFYLCSNLKTVVFPDNYSTGATSYLTICKNSFSKCTSLSKVIFPNNSESKWFYNATKSKANGTSVGTSAECAENINSYSYNTSGNLYFYKVD